MTAGVYYFDQSFSFSETRDLNNHAQLLATRSNLDNRSFAAFAEVDIEPVADLTVTMGGRYTEEKQKTSSAPLWACSFDLATGTFTGPQQNKRQLLSHKQGLSFTKDHQ